jgi:hypothetical protein
MMSDIYWSRRSTYIDNEYNGVNTMWCEPCLESRIADFADGDQASCPVFPTGGRHFEVRAH